MRVTPYEIAKKEFTASTEGVNEKEVKEYLAIVREEMEDLLRENDSLRKDVKQLQKDLQQKEDFDKLIWGFVAQVAEMKTRTK